MALSSLASYISTMTFRKGFNLVPNMKRAYRNTWPLHSARAPQRRRHPIPPDDLPRSLESDADFKEIPVNIPGVPKASEGQRRNFIAIYYTNVLKASPQRDWKDHGTISIIREEIRVLGGASRRPFLMWFCSPRRHSFTTECSNLL